MLIGAFLFSGNLNVFLFFIFINNKNFIENIRPCILGVYRKYNQIKLLKRKIQKLTQRNTRN